MLDTSNVTRTSVEIDKDLLRRVKIQLLKLNKKTYFKDILNTLLSEWVEGMEKRNG